MTGIRQKRPGWRGAPEVPGATGPDLYELRMGQVFGRPSMTMREVHERAGLSYATVCRIELGERRASETTLAKLSAGLGYPVTVVRQAYSVTRRKAEAGTPVPAA